MIHNQINVNTDENKAAKLVLSLFSPFIALLYSIKTINTKSSIAVLILFCVCFGMAFTVDNVRTAGSGDGISYRIDFEDYTHDSGVNYYWGLQDYLSFNGETKDYYFDTVAFFVSRVTSNYHWCFFVFAIVFTYFMIKSLKFFVYDDYFQTSAIGLLLLFLFTWNQIFNINGMRFWTAAWVATYCLLQIMINNNKRYFVLAFFIPFIHGSYLIFNGVLVAAYLLKRFEKVWIVSFILSFFVSQLSLTLAADYSQYLPSFMQSSVDFYTDSDYINRISSGGTGFYWVSQIFDVLYNTYVNILFFILILNRNKVELSDTDRKLYQFMIVFMTFVNFCMAIPSLGSRFFMVSFPMIAYLWLRFFKLNKFNNVIYLLPFAFAMKTYYLICNYIEVTDFSFYITGPFIHIFKYLF